MPPTATLPPLPTNEPKNRLTLAKWLVSDDNPLVARVVMNRIWMRYFGRGIVNSVDPSGIVATHRPVATSERPAGWRRRP